MLIKRATTNLTEPKEAVETFYREVYQQQMAYVFFYCSPTFNLKELGLEIQKKFNGVNVVGCTTAGELSHEGYKHGSLTGVSIDAQDIQMVTELIGDLKDFSLAQGEDLSNRLFSRMTELAPESTKDNMFSFLLIDGLSTLEEPVVNALYNSMENIPLFGGSAGDETAFGKTHIYCAGEFRSNAALLTLCFTTHPFSVFKTQHFVPSTDKAVITAADPTRRIVFEINGKPAAPEYARIIGVDFDELSPLTFATNPVVVRVGGEDYVRSIQKVNPDNSLTFYCAIDEGIVLTLSKGIGLVDNLNDLFTEIKSEIGPPLLVLGCDCILRHLELDREGIKEQVGKIMSENNVIGFSTYGEQYKSMHVNQTFTGVAIGKKSS